MARVSSNLDILSPPIFAFIFWKKKEVQNNALKMTAKKYLETEERYIRYFISGSGLIGTILLVLRRRSFTLFIFLISLLLLFVSGLGSPFIDSSYLTTPPTKKNKKKCFSNNYTKISSKLTTSPGHSILP